ncbi:hypothetical protein V8C86DRAFT_2939675 [Haematococcus lacustris]
MLTPLATVRGAGTGPAQSGMAAQAGSAARRRGRARQGAWDPGGISPAASPGALRGLGLPSLTPAPSTSAGRQTKAGRVARLGARGKGSGSGRGAAVARSKEQGTGKGLGAKPRVQGSRAGRAGALLHISTAHVSAPCLLGGAVRIGVHLGAVTVSGRGAGRRAGNRSETGQSVALTGGRTAAGAIRKARWAVAVMPRVMAGPVVGSERRSSMTQEPLLQPMASTPRGQDRVSLAAVLLRHLTSRAAAGAGRRLRVIRGAGRDMSGAGRRALGPRTARAGALVAAPVAALQAGMRAL